MSHLMGLFRKTLFVATGGMSGAVGIKANSKKERIAKASEKQVRLMQGKPVGINRVLGTPPQPMRTQQTPAAAPQPPWQVVDAPGKRSTTPSAPEPAMDGPATPPATPTPSPALTIAEERYARSEITREEFLQIKQDLTS